MRLLTRRKQIAVGKRLARIEVPALVWQLRQMRDKEEDGHDQ